MNRAEALIEFFDRAEAGSSASARVLKLSKENQECAQMCRPLFQRHAASGYDVMHAPSEVLPILL